MTDLRLKKRIEDGDREALEHIARALEGGVLPSPSTASAAPEPDHQSNGTKTARAHLAAEAAGSPSLELAPSGIETLLEAMPAAIGVLKDDALIMINSAFAYAFGYRSAAHLMEAGGVDAILPGGLAALSPSGTEGVTEDVEALSRSRRRLNVAFALTMLDPGADLRLLRLLDQTDLDQTDLEQTELDEPDRTEMTSDQTEQGQENQDWAEQESESRAKPAVVRASILTATLVPPVTPVPDRKKPADVTSTMDTTPELVERPARTASAPDKASGNNPNVEAATRQLEFLAKVSHEVRTPLNSIIGFAELMLHERFGSIGNARYKGYAEDIHQSGLYALSLLNDLLDISKIEAGKFDVDFTAVDAAEVIEACVSSLQPLAKRTRIVLRSSFADDLPQIVTDPRRLRQVMLNLLTNAIKFTNEGGQVIVSGTVIDGELRLRVHDSGVGMSKSDIAYAMQPFHQLDTSPRHQSGTGLGLPLTKALTDAIRARLELSSEPGIGTSADVIFSAERLFQS